MTKPASKPAEILPFADSLEELALSQLFLYHMTDRLSPAQVDEAKDIVVQRIKEGERHLRELYDRLKADFFNGREMQVAAFTDYLSYLKFLYENRPCSIDAYLQYLRGTQKDMVGKYVEITSNNSAREKNVSFIQSLQQTPLYIELEYPLEPKGKARLVICRRKDTERGIEKIAERLVAEQRQTEWKKQESTKGRVEIDDWFGLKVVGYHKQDAEEMFKRSYARLQKYRLQPDERRESITKNGRISGEQPPGVDNKYQYGETCQMIQLKVRNIRQSSNRLQEIDFTDIVNMLIDEMEHMLWRTKCKGEFARSLKSRKDKQRYERLIARGRELAEKLPKQRRRILMPNEYFE
ncbi:MAG: hypothetical protein AB1668_04685 [Nanoarchaeota archaeon]